ncbi:hypothetical protein EON81_02895 [bacterium]|nr:MAG: hypothetical protein EON81_02895 [bacterium]
MLAAFLLTSLVVPPQESAARVYADSQRRLGALDRLVMLYSLGGECGADDQLVSYRRGRKTLKSHLDRRIWVTDCVTTLQDETRRPAKPEDLDTAWTLGFESFAPPRIAPIPIGKVRIARVYDKPVLALDMDLAEGGRETLFLDPETRLPVGSGKGGFQTGYALLPQDGEEMSSLYVNTLLQTELRWIRSLSFRVAETGERVEFVKPEFGRHANLPGMEAFFGESETRVGRRLPVGRVTLGGTACLTYEVYGSDDRRYRLYVDADRYLPMGYDELSNEETVAIRRFTHVIADDPRLLTAPTH